MNVFLLNHLNLLARNTYLFENFTKGKLREIFEADKTINVNSSMFLNTLCIENPYVFYCKNPDLNFIDFLFLQNLDIESEDIIAVLLLAKFGSDCKVFLNRSILYWLMESNANKRTNRRYVTLVENFIKKENMAFRADFKTIDEAVLNKYKVNTAFDRYIRLRVKTYHASGTLVDINFFFLNVLPSLKTPRAKKLLHNFIEIVKANNKYTNYLECKLNNKILLSPSISEYKREESVLFEIKNAFSIFDSDMAKICEEIEKKTLPINITESVINDNGESIDSFSDDEDVISNQINGNSIEITFVDISQHVKLFSLNKRCILKKTTNVTRDVKKLLSDSIKNIDDIIYQMNSKELGVRCCVLLYYKSEDKSYQLLCRQIKTTRNVLTLQKDYLVCGWYGMRQDIKKKTIMKKLREHKDDYNIRGISIMDIDAENENNLIMTLSEIIKSIENVDYVYVQNNVYNPIITYDVIPVTNVNCVRYHTANDICASADNIEDPLETTIRCAEACLNYDKQTLEINEATNVQKEDNQQQYIVKDLTDCHYINHTVNGLQHLCESADSLDKIGLDLVDDIVRASTII